MTSKRLLFQVQSQSGLNEQGSSSMRVSPDAGNSPGNIASAAYLPRPIDKKEDVEDIITCLLDLKLN